MVFSSIPGYLDPSNWQQLQDHQQQGIGNENFQLPPLHPTAAHHVSGGGMSIRPNSIADRARMLKIPQPEGPLNCPRCESTNTKFCYYNNYSLSQPRHFCKTCRRYWTRGGALRNVPVGGGCRRSKKSKSSKTTSAATEKQTGFDIPSRGIPSACPTDIIGHLPQPSQFPSMASLQNLTRFGLQNIGFNGTCLKSSGLQRQLEAGYVAGDQANMGFQIETDLGRKNCTSTGLPLLAAGFETPTWFYSSLQSESLVDPSIKMVGNQDPKLLSSSSVVGGKNQFWGGNSWTNLSGTLGSSSPSTTHLL